MRGLRCVIGLGERAFGGEVAEWAYAGGVCTLSCLYEAPGLRDFNVISIGQIPLSSVQHASGSHDQT